MGKYTDYVMKTAQDLLAVPSPSGFTHMAAEFVKKEFDYPEGRCARKAWRKRR